MAFRDESSHGVDADTGLVHSMRATAANVHDVTKAHNLLHGGETMVWCDAGYQGVHKRAENLGGRWTGKSRWAWERGGGGGEAEGVGKGQEPAPDCDRGWSIPS